MQSQLRFSPPGPVSSGRHAFRASPCPAAFKPAIVYRQCSFIAAKRVQRQQRSLVVRAGEDYTAITAHIEAAAAEAREGLGGTSIYLVGMMGSGKSTVGKLVANALQYCFFDTDDIIEQLAGKAVSEIFAEDGEASFRDLETQVIKELSPFASTVVATGGGIVTRGENWGHMHGGIVVWLSGSPELLAHRVVADGTGSRPLLAQEGSEDGDAYRGAVQRLGGLLEKRQGQYEFADITVPLEGAGPQADLGAPTAVVALRVLEAIHQRIKADAEMRKERMNFEIVDEGELPESIVEIVEGDLPDLRSVLQSPAGAGDGEDPLLP